MNSPELAWLNQAAAQVVAGQEPAQALRAAAQAARWRGPLPGLDALAAAVHTHLALFGPHDQADQLAALRRLALGWMERWPALRPHLSGAVWLGLATAAHDVIVQLFADDPKAAELSLIDAGLDFTVQPARGWRGQTVDALSLWLPCAALGREVALRLMVYDFDDLRGALRPDAQGRVLRGDARALRALLAPTADAVAPGTVASGAAGLKLEFNDD